MYYMDKKIFSPSLVVDNEMDINSNNPISNTVVTKAIHKLMLDKVVTIQKFSYSVRVSTNYSNVTFDFDREYSKPPIVLVTVLDSRINGTTGGLQHVGGLHNISSVTTTGFTMRKFSNGSYSAHTVTILCLIIEV